jgi:hypothetical protein
LPQFEDNRELLEKQPTSKAKSQSTTKSGKKKIHEQTIGQFTKMVENNTIMVIFFEKINLLERIVHQMD